MNISLPLHTILAVLPDVKACTADQSLVLQAITSLENAGVTDLAIVLDRGDASVFDPVSLKAVENSCAGAVLAGCDIPGKPTIVVADVVKAYDALTTYIIQQCHYDAATIAPSATVHPSAVIDAGVVIGNNAVVHPLAYIGRGAVIGNGAIIHPGAKILSRCLVGDGSIIHANAVIGSDGFGYQVSSQGLRKLTHIGIVRIGKGVEIGASCMIDRAMFNETRIGDGTKIDNGVHIAHNVSIGASCAILAQTGIAGSVVIGNGCQIGGQVAIKDHVTIGDGAKIVSKSAVMHNIAAGETVCGIPAIPFTQWKRISVSLTKLPELIKLAKQYAAPVTTAKAWWQRFFGV
ncbi:UDP-3-O-(3-hydroxymyristoyl)glucosamine N-acyltransferase [Candidatus Dependentiae bacterium]|nr:UDP-3-O-(3-hydroxymyristoyl)glucosamine N-acyltransferase [Candidatus Dependentiae bacterium]